MTVCGAGARALDAPQTLDNRPGFAGHALARLPTPFTALLLLPLLVWVSVAEGATGSHGGRHGVGCGRTCLPRAIRDRSSRRRDLHRVHSTCPGASCEAASHQVARERFTKNAPATRRRGGTRPTRALGARRQTPRVGETARRRVRVLTTAPCCPTAASYRCFLSSASIFARGTAPTIWPTTWPPLKTSRVGIERMPYFCGVA